MDPDYQQTRDLVEMIQPAIDRAHWLGVHRNHRQARFIEEILKTARAMSWDLSAEISRRWQSEAHD